jgi:hypothetical protein
MNAGRVPETIWSSGDYDLKFAISEENKAQKNITIPFGDQNDEERFYSKMYKENRTLYLHY